MEASSGSPTHFIAAKDARQRVTSQQSCVRHVANENSPCLGNKCGPFRSRAQPCLLEGARPRPPRSLAHPFSNAASPLQKRPAIAAAISRVFAATPPDAAIAMLLLDACMRRAEVFGGRFALAALAAMALTATLHMSECTDFVASLLEMTGAGMGALCSMSALICATVRLRGFPTRSPRAHLVCPGQVEWNLYVAPPVFFVEAFLDEGGGRVHVRLMRVRVWPRRRCAATLASPQRLSSSRARGALDELYEVALLVREEEGGATGHSPRVTARSTRWRRCRRVTSCRSARLWSPRPSYALRGGCCPCEPARRMRDDACKNPHAPPADPCGTRTSSAPSRRWAGRPCSPCTSCCGATRAPRGWRAAMRRAQGTYRSPFRASAPRAFLSARPPAAPP